MHDLRDHEAHGWLLRHQGSAGERAKNEATVRLVTSRYPGTNSDVVVVVMAAPPGTAGSRSPGTTRIIDLQSVVGTTELALPIDLAVANAAVQSRHLGAGRSALVGSETAAAR
jgi:hypothetical protein